MYGELKVVCGPMFSGKTSSIMRDYLWHKHSNNSFELYKPSFDTRWHKETITTHTGLQAEATCISDVGQISAIRQFYLFDEIQFFDGEHVTGDIVQSIKYLLSMGKNVAVCGLDTDWKGDPFIVTAKLLAMADKVEKLQSICTHSGLPATKTYKKKEYRDGDTVELGASDIYEARNNQFFGD